MSDGSGRPLALRTVEAALEELGTRVDYAVIDGRGTREYLPVKEETA